MGLRLKTFKMARLVNSSLSKANMHARASTNRDRVSLGFSWEGFLSKNLISAMLVLIERLSLLGVVCKRGSS